MIKILQLFMLVVLFISCNERSQPVPGDDEIKQLYKDIRLDNVIDYKAFDIAYKGYLKIGNNRKKDILTIIDYTKPSTEERLFIIDPDKKNLMLKSYVAHGRNSGENYASSFSNISGSLKSSPGFYLTAGTYIGKHGFSLRLEGLEKGINDNALARAIVIHGADYVSDSFIEKYGRLGRSWGCPAVPVELTHKIIDLIEGGSCLFIYTDDAEYFSKSKYTDEGEILPMK